MATPLSADRESLFAVKPLDALVVIEVHDRGCGMTRDELARAFDPFFTTRPDGTGLGLASVLATLRRLGGSVELESDVGQGTRVRLTWPAVGEVAVAS